MQASLLDPSYVIQELRDLNDDGQILAVARHQNITKSILLTPVPEPASIATVGLGLAALARRRRPRPPDPE